VDAGNLGGGIAVEVDGDHAGSFSEKEQSGFLADAAAGAGDERYLVF